MQFTEDGSTKQSITGKHSYVYGPTGESVTNEEEVWSILQKDVEVYNRIREEVGLEGLEESDIDIWDRSKNFGHSKFCTNEKALTYLTISPIQSTPILYQQRVCEV